MLVTYDGELMQLADINRSKRFSSRFESEIPHQLLLITGVTNGNHI